MFALIIVDVDNIGGYCLSVKGKCGRTIYNKRKTVPRSYIAIDTCETALTVSVTPADSGFYPASRYIAGDLCGIFFIRFSPRIKETVVNVSLTDENYGFPIPAAEMTFRALLKR